jgi:hypothetical protein
MSQMPNNWRIVTVTMADLSTGSSVWVASPCDGYIREIYSVIANAVTTADNAVTVEIGGVAVTGATITVAYDGSAAGDVDVSYPTALNYVRKGQAIEIITAGTCDTTCITTFTVVIED